MEFPVFTIKKETVDRVSEFRKLHPEINLDEHINSAILAEVNYYDFIRAEYEEKLNRVYEERNKCVALIYHMARKLGYGYGMRQSSNFEPGWQFCAIIDLPTGQVSWHIKDEEEDWFAEGDEIMMYNGEWDGHDTEEKYKRVINYGQV